MNSSRLAGEAAGAHVRLFDYSLDDDSAQAWKLRL
jgi:hypothetical protein